MSSSFLLDWLYLTGTKYSDLSLQSACTPAAKEELLSHYLQKHDKAIINVTGLLINENCLFF